MIKEIRLYYTDDGSTFRNLKDAQEYEANHFLSVTDDDILLYNQKFDKINIKYDKFDYDSIFGVIIKTKEGRKYFQKILNDYDFNLTISESDFKENELYFWNEDECLWESVTNYLQYINDNKFNGKLHLRYGIPNN